MAHCRLPKRTAMKLQKQPTRLTAGGLFLLSTLGAPGVFALALIAAASLASAAEIVTVQMDTTSWKGTSAQLALDFVGEGSPTNLIEITSFQTDGVLGNQTPTGDEFGMLPGTVTMRTSPSSFFNEDLADITLGSYVYFQFGARVNVGPRGAFPDEFSFFILDSQGNPLVTTADPTGANAIAMIDLTGDSSPFATSYSSDVTLTQGTAPARDSAVPEPSTVTLIAFGAAWVLLRKRLRKILLAMTVCVIAGGCAFAESSPPGLLGEDGWISAQCSGLRLNRTTNTFDATVTLVNLNSKPIKGPFYLGISGITNSNVSLANSAGMILEHIPYILLSTPTQLPVGEPVVAGVLKFNNPSKGAFEFNTGVWDAGSLATALNMNCPINTGTINGAGIYSYATPIDNYGRTASCVPASGSYFPNGNNLVQCVTGGTGSPYPPGYCNFQYLVAYDPVGPPVNLTTADLSLGTCQKLTPNAAGEIILSGGNYSQNTPCAKPQPGTATFTIANNGPFAATNVVLTLGVPKQYIAAYATQFSQAATCRDIGPSNFPDGTPFTQGDLLACTFASLNSGDVIQATVGFDTPPHDPNPAVPTLNAYVSSDTPDTNLTNNAIAFNVAPALRDVQFIPPPVPQPCRLDPDDHTFDVLIDTCGAPPLAVEIVTSVFLGAATMVTGAGEAGIVTGAIDVETNVVFRCEAAQVLHLLNPIYDPEL